MRKFILIIMLAICFLLSSENAKESNIRSRNFLENTMGRIYIMDEEKEEEWNYYIRKFAHFTLYFCVGCATIFWLDSKNLSFFKKFMLSIFLLFCFASFDEIHQFYTGRCLLVKDILIDSLGGLSALVLWAFWQIKRPKKSFLNDPVSTRSLQKF